MYHLFYPRLNSKSIAIQYESLPKSIIKKNKPAAKQVGFEVPVVVRLEGTNVERARALLAKANIAALTTAQDLSDAAEKVCAAIC